MVRMISGSTRIGKRTYTSADGFFEAAPEVERRLVLLGVAEYAAKALYEPVATDAAPVAGDTPCADMPSEENGAESDAEAHLDPEQLKTLTNAKLTELAKEMGIDTAKLKTKAQLISAITDVPLEDAIAEDDDGEAPPVLTPEAPIV